MKTVTVTKARAKLGDLLSRALKGEDIGLVHSASGRIVALRPVEVYSEDYALMEYGLGDKELERAAKRTDAEIQKARKAGKLKRIA